MGLPPEKNLSRPVLFLAAMASLCLDKQYVHVCLWHTLYLYALHACWQNIGYMKTSNIKQGVNVLDKEDNWFRRGVKEAINIKWTSSDLNRDRGRHHLDQGPTTG